MSRSGFGLAGGLLALLSTTAVATGSTSLETYPPAAGPPATVGGIFVRADGQSSRIMLSYDERANTFLIRDTRPLKLRAVRGGSPRPCRILDRGRARCPNPEPSAARAAITVPLRGGDDLLLPQRTLRTPIAGSGGPGADEVNGARGDDILKGGPAADVVRGLDGDDTLIGSNGDDLQGGEGADTILADYGSVERSIDCGDGYDRAFVDPADPATVGCEEIVR